MSNNDLISRAAAIAEIEEYIDKYSELEPETGFHNAKWCAMEEAKDVLLRQPAIDAAPVVHAHWCERGGLSSRCSYCGRTVQKETAYCPHCGVIMRRDAPTVDAAPVIRCKDCEYSYFADNRVPAEQSFVCGRTGCDVTPDWFCAAGQR